ncbi:phosphotransferase [Streptomyces parvulus]|uniref:phosphotransferase n=1 Tax=Streptomyces parvulus TaxID=146923 RepID=UPI00342F3FCF
MAGAAAPVVRARTPARRGRTRGGLVQGQSARQRLRGGAHRGPRPVGAGARAGTAGGGRPARLGAPARRGTALPGRPRAGCRRSRRLGGTGAPVRGHAVRPHPAHGGDHAAGRPRRPRHLAPRRPRPPRRQPAGRSRTARLRELRPRLPDWCAELASLGVPDSLDHADLHDGQVLRPRPGRFTFFDWGDALVSHPFAGLTVPARRAREDHGPGILPRLRDAYLEPWTGAGRSTADLRRAVSLAWRLSALGRAAAYGRLFPTTSGTTGAATAEAGARCLLELLDDPPL